MVREGPRSVVLDARTAQRYRGDSDPIDPRAGHIPGALNAPFRDNLTGDPLPVFLTAAELRSRYETLGADRAAPIVYCGSGVTACHNLLALELAGLRGRLYAGSWSEWSADPSLPVATGDDRS
jgi:thiosulfate/3-mercaptopyruvate sulfurtransferase